ncbi:MAG: hypothetical protein ABEJ42_04340 [Halobacteriaceae archaeon]
MRRRTLLGALAGTLGGCSAPTRPTGSGRDDPQTRSAGVRERLSRSSATRSPPRSSGPTASVGRTDVHGHPVPGCADVRRSVDEGRDDAGEPLAIAALDVDDAALRRAAGLAVDVAVERPRVDADSTAVVDVTVDVAAGRPTGSDGRADAGPGAAEHVVVTECPDSARGLQLADRCGDGDAALVDEAPTLVDGRWTLPDSQGPRPLGVPCRERAHAVPFTTRYWLLGLGPGSGGPGVYETTDASVPFVPPDGPVTAEETAPWSLTLAIRSARPT